MAVNKERLKLGIDALRSGKYEQGTNRLCTIEDDDRKTFCCLGVLTEVAIENGLKLERHPSEDGLTIEYDGEKYFLPSSVVDWYGLPGDDPELGRDPGYDEDEECQATYFNDEAGYTFEEIANLFERKYLK